MQKFGGKSRKYKQTDISEELIVVAADIGRLSNISPPTHTVWRTAVSDFKNWCKKDKKELKNTWRVVGMFTMKLSDFNCLQNLLEHEMKQ
jgi:hypothetical protein